MKNFVQPGESVEYTAPMGGVTSGAPKQIGKLLVVPAVTVAAGARFNGVTCGVFTVTKVGSQAWTEGAIVYWDAGNNRFTTSSGGNLQAGTAVAAVGGGSILLGRWDCRCWSR